MTSRSLQCLVAGLIFTTSVWAQLPNPTLTEVFPPGAAVGASQTVTVTGRDLDEGSQLLFSHPGIIGHVRTNDPGEFESTPTPIQNQFDVVVSENVPPGRYEVRVVGRFGASTPRAFFVEAEPALLPAGQNHSIESANELTPNRVVYGRADANVVDYYRFDAKQGQAFSVECLTRSMDSRLQPIVTVFDEQGRQMRRSRVTVDPVIEFVAPAEGTYFVGVHDHVYAGGAEYLYRLDVRSQPYVAFVVPPVAEPGQSNTFELVGLNLPGGTESDYQLDGIQLQKRQVRVYVPEAVSLDAVVHGGETRTHGIHHFPFQWDSEQGNANIARIGLADNPIVMEQDENNTPAQAQSIQVPAEVVGQFYPRRDQDWVEFKATKGQRFQVRLFSNRLGHLTDPEIYIQKVTKDAQGAEQVSQVVTQDDASFDQNRYKLRLPRALDLSHQDPDVSFAADADATYRVGVRDLYGGSRNDPRIWYRLQIRPQLQDFELVAWSQRQAVDNDKKIQAASPSLRPGGNLPVCVDVIRRHGFAGPVRLVVEGLPAGVTAAASVVEAGRSDGILLLHADESAKDWTGVIRVVGEAVIGEENVRRAARNAVLLAETGDVQNSRPRARLTRDLVLSVLGQDPAPIAVNLGGQVIETSRGAKLEIPLAYQKAVTVKGELALAAIVGNNEIKPAELKLAADAKDGKLQVPLNTDKVPLGKHTLFLRGKVKFDYARNPQAIARAEQSRKDFDGVLTALTQQGTELTEQLAAAKAVVASRTEIIGKFEVAQDASSKAIQAAVEASRRAAEQVKAYQAMASASGNDPDLAEAVRQAQDASAQAIMHLDNAQKALTRVSQKMQRFAKELENATNEVARIEAAQKQVAEKQQRAEAHKQALDKRIEESKKNFGPKELNAWVDSTPVTLQIHKSPVQVNLSAGDIATTPGKMTELHFAIERRFSFADAVDVELTLPESAKGLSAEVVSLNKDQSEGVLKIMSAEDSVKGDFKCVLKTKLKFNDLAIEDEIPLVVRVQ